MAKCDICGKDTGFMPFACADGHICKDCEALIPSVLKKYARSEGLFLVKNWINYTKKYIKGLRKKFVVTSSCGMLHIDEWHGLFAICDKKHIKDDKLPDSCTDIFSALFLADYGITINNAVASETSVKVDVVFHCVMNKPNVQFTKTLCTVSCYAKRINDEQITYTEPSDLTLFRSLFYQAIVNARDRYQNKIFKDFISPDAVALMKARALFMVDDGYSLDEIKKQRNRLIKAFHPDEHSLSEEVEELTGYTELINNAFRLLKENIGK